jgi:hypothetical protein
VLTLENRSYPMNSPAQPATHKSSGNSAFGSGGKLLTGFSV